MTKEHGEFKTAWLATKPADRPWSSPPGRAANSVLSIGANQFIKREDWIAGRTGPTYMIFQGRIQVCA